MVLGVGTDIVEIERIEKAIRKEQFRKKCFTETELAYLYKKKANSYAGYFCAKEAAAKALGRGFKGLGLKDIEIQNNEFGKPVLLFYNNALEISKQLKVGGVYVSISHSQSYATAVVVIESF